MLSTLPKLKMEELGRGSCTLTAHFSKTKELTENYCFPKCTAPVLCLAPPSPTALRLWDILARTAGLSIRPQTGPGGCAGIMAEREERGETWSEVSNTKPLFGEMDVHFGG